jgi:transposase
MVERKVPDCVTTALAVHTSKSAAAELMRVSWRAVGAAVERVAAEAEAKADLLDGLRRIGIDEIAHRKGQRYLTVVVDHDTGRMVWAHAGRDKATVERFLEELGPERCAKLELVSCDMAEWIRAPIEERCPQAVRCVDPFHVAKLATDALDEIRRETWNEARRAGQRQVARELKGARFALWKNAGNLTGRQHGNDGLNWPRCDGLNWPHLRPTVSPRSVLCKARTGGRRKDGIESGVLRADSQGP